IFLLFGFTAELRSAWTGAFGSAQGRLRPVATRTLVFVAWCGVVAAARLDLVIALVGPDLNFTERPIARGVGGHIANTVLAAQFLGNLVEGLAEFFDLVADVDHAAAGFLCEFLHLGIAVIAEAAQAVKTAI